MDISSRSVMLANIHNHTDQYRKTHERIFGKKDNKLLYIEKKNGKDTGKKLRKKV